jgi:hypothetical protein
LQLRQAQHRQHHFSAAYEGLHINRWDQPNGFIATTHGTLRCRWEGVSNPSIEITKLREITSTQ